jgi:hypothetical protein
MPQAPDIVPSIAPTTQGVAGPSLPVPVDAFGGAVGLALEHMGGAIEQSANKIWERAVQLQDIQNRTEVDNADAEFIKQTALAHAKFNSQLGTNAGPDALAKHIEEIEGIRTGIRNSLSNPMSQRMFNSTSLSTMGRYISNASNHSANEVKNAYRQGLALRQSTYANEVADSPDDPEPRRKFRAITHLIADEKGIPESDRGEFVTNAESPVNLETVSRVMDRNPELGKKMMEDYHAQGKLVGEQYTAALKKYEQAAYRILPDQIATQITADLKSQTDPERTGATLQEREQQARDIAQKKYPDLPLMAKEAERATRAAYNDHLSAVRDLNWRDKNLAGDILEGNYSPNGKAPTTMAEFTAAPGGADAIKRMTYSQQQAVKRALLNNATGVYLPTEENTKAYHQLYGQLTSDDPKVRAAAMDVFVPGLEMPKNYRATLGKLQDQLYKGTPQDPRIGQAMQEMKPSLAGMSKDDRDQFRGAFSLIIQEEMAKNQNKSLPLDEVRKIGARLLQKVPGTGWFTDDSLFQMKRSDIEEYKKQMESEGTVMTDQQIQSDYVRKLYNALKKTGQTSLAVPRSSGIPPDTSGGAQ